LEFFGEGGGEGEEVKEIGFWCCNFQLSEKKEEEEKSQTTQFIK